MSFLCNHEYIPKTGMDSGSICIKCGKSTDKEIDIVKSGGLNNETLKNVEVSDKISEVRRKYSLNNTLSKIFKNY